MQIWIFKMKKTSTLLLLVLLSVGGCASTDGQIVYHWTRPRTGVEKFVRDHSKCMREAEPFKILPRFKTFFHDMFYSEEQKLEVRADWDSEQGIWASYIPYTGAQPVVVNYLRDDSDADPATYSKCMTKKGYTTRSYDIPEITNIKLHNFKN